LFGRPFLEEGLAFGAVDEALEGIGRRRRAECPIGHRE